MPGIVLSTLPIFSLSLAHPPSVIVTKNKLERHVLAGPFQAVQCRASIGNPATSLLAGSPTALEATSKLEREERKRSFTKLLEANAPARTVPGLRRELGGLLFTFSKQMVGHKSACFSRILTTRTPYGETGGPTAAESGELPPPLPLGCWGERAKLELPWCREAHHEGGQRNMGCTCVPHSRTGRGGLF